MADIIIDDSYVAELAECIEKYGETFEEFYERYLTLLRGFHARGVSSGNTADAIQSYIATAEGLKNYVADSAGVLGQTLREYLNEVDEADRYLY